MNKLKKWLKTGLALLAVNFLSTPVLVSAVYSISKSSVNHNKLEQEILLNEFNHDLPENYSVFEYLSIAQSNVSYTREHYYGISTPVCRDMAKSTYHAYLFLTELNGREDLQNKVRVTFGKVNIPELDKNFYHVWLEYKKDEKFQPFETTIYNNTIENHSDLFYAEMENIYFNQMLKEDIMFEVVHSIPGTKYYYPTIDSFYKGGGLSGVMYTFVRTCPEILESGFPEFWDLVTKN